MKEESLAIGNQQTIQCPITGVEFKTPGRVWNPGPFGRKRMFVTGPYRSGKSSLCASTPNALVLDLEGKYDLIPSPAATYICPRDFGQVLLVLEWLEKQAKDGNRPFKTIVIDTVDEMVSGMIIPWLTERLPEGWRKDNPISDITDYKAGKKGSGGWAMVTGKTLSVTARLGRAGYGWVVAGHEREDHRPAVNPGVFGGLYRQSEFACRTTLRERTKTSEKKLASGKVIRVSIPTKELEGLLYVETKQADESTGVGGNLALPSPIGIPLGRGMEAIEKAYMKSIENLRGE